MFTDTINENELKMNIIKNNIEMHFDKFNLRSFWSHLMNLTSYYRLHKVYNTIIKRAVCLNCYGREMGYNILGREALEKSVVYHLNII